MLDYTGPVLGRLRNLDVALARYGALVNTYGESLMLGDPLADDFAADCAQLGHATGMRMFNQALSGERPVDQIHGAPDSLHALIAQLEEMPDWVDPEQIERGATVFCRHAREAALAMGTTSLVSGYRSAAAARPLFITGRYGPRLAQLRSYETSRWIFATARPGGLTRFGGGFTRTARVRMIHAFVRRHIREVADWDTHDAGLPINQADIAFTAIEFSLLPIRAMQDLGIHFKQPELDAMYAMWRYMGHLIGLDERVLIVRDGDVQTFEALRHLTSPPPDDDCREFVRVLLDDVMVVDVGEARGLLGIVGRRYGRSLLHGLTRAFVGDEIADELEILNNAWKHVPALTKPVLALTTRLMALVPALQARAVRRNLVDVDNLLAANARALGVQHDLVDAAPVTRPR